MLDRQVLLDQMGEQVPPELQEQRAQEETQEQVVPLACLVLQVQLVCKEPQGLQVFLVLLDYKDFQEVLVHLEPQEALDLQATLVRQVHLAHKAVQVIRAHWGRPDQQVLLDLEDYLGLLVQQVQQVQLVSLVFQE